MWCLSWDMRWGRHGLLSGVHDDCARLFFFLLLGLHWFSICRRPPTPLSSHASTLAFCCTKKSSTATLFLRREWALTCVLFLRFPVLFNQSTSLLATYIRAYIHSRHFFFCIGLFVLTTTFATFLFLLLFHIIVFLRWSYIL